MIAATITDYQKTMAVRWAEELMPSLRSAERDHLEILVKLAEDKDRPADYEQVMDAARKLADKADDLRYELNRVEDAASDLRRLIEPGDGL